MREFALAFVFMRATRIWISAVWRSRSLAARRSMKALRQRIHSPASDCEAICREGAVIVAISSPSGI
jgi:hypothetical protein